MTEARRSLESTLQMVVGTMLPQDTARKLPGADDAVIFVAIRDILDNKVASMHVLVEEIEGRLGRDFDTLSQDQREALINEWYAAGSPAALALGRVVLSAYYRDDRVLRALGLEARAPFPQGHVVEAGDWSLLDPVKRRATFWRDDKADPSASAGRPDKGGPADGSGGA